MKKTVTFGEIMLRLSTENNARFTDASTLEVNFGGAEANVAVSLAHFGLPASFVSRLPDNDLGLAAIKRLRAENVGTSHIIHGDERMGIYFIEPGAGQRNSSIIYDRQGSAMAAIRKGMIDWDEIFKEADWFHWSGITPAISLNAAEVCREAVDAARKNGLSVSCDLNYRATLWKYGKNPSEIMPELVADCDALIADPDAGEKMLGLSPGDASPENFLKVTSHNFSNLKIIATTLRDLRMPDRLDFSGMLLHQGRLFKGQVHHISSIVDRVGSGDAFTAGLIYGVKTFAGDYQRTLDFALAAACLKHTVRGDFNIVSIQEVNDLMNGNNGGHIRR